MSKEIKNWQDQLEKISMLFSFAAACEVISYLISVKGNSYEFFYKSCMYITQNTEGQKKIDLNQHSNKDKKIHCLVMRRNQWIIMPPKGESFHRVFPMYEILILKHLFYGDASVVLAIFWTEVNKNCEVLVYTAEVPVDVEEYCTLLKL